MDGENGGRKMKRYKVYSRIDTWDKWSLQGIYTNRKLAEKAERELLILGEFEAKIIEEEL